MFGIRNIRRFAALVVLCAAVAPVTAAQTHAEISANPLTVEVDETLNSATFRVRSSTPTRVSISVGTDRPNMVSKRHGSLDVFRSMRITPLAPATEYFYTVTATDKSGRSLSRVGKFTTGQVRPATLTVDNGRFRLNGVPFFPIMAKMYTECPSREVVDDSVAMGANVFDHVGWPYCADENNVARHVTSTELHELLRGKAWWLERNLFFLTGLPEWMNLQGEMFIEMAAGDLWACGQSDSSASLIPGRLRASIARHLQQGEATVYRSPVIASGGVSTCMTAQRSSVQFWLAPLAGAAGIEYDTILPHRLKDGVHVRSDVMKQAGIDAKRLKTLYPVILAGADSKVASSSADVVVRSWSWGGSIYAVAVNTENKSVSATIRWPSKAIGTVKVLWQDRSKKLTAGGITDQFRPHQVHIYQLR